MVSSAFQEMRASYAFVERNIYLVRRYWTWEMVWMVYSITNSLSVSYIGMGMEQVGGEGVDGRFLVLYLVIGTLVWRYLATIFYWITDIIGLERWEGTIEYTLMAPIRRITHMTGQTLFAVVYSFLFTSVILLVTVKLFDINLDQANIFGATVVLLSGSLSFIGVGIVGSILPLLFPERGAQMTHVIIATLLLISGVYYPINVLPDLLQKAAIVSPATYVLQGVRSAMLDGVPLGSLWPNIWPALLIGVIAIPVGLQIFGVAERYAKRTGKLSRDG
jgi:ABC-2 type transport system permease protein